MIVPYLTRKEREYACTFNARRLTPDDLVESSFGFTSGIFGRDNTGAIIVKGMSALDADPLVVMLIRTLCSVRRGPTLLP